MKSETEANIPHTSKKCIILYLKERSIFYTGHFSSFKLDTVLNRPKVWSN